MEFDNPQAASRNAVRLRVFVVENHADTREFLRVLLQDLGHEVTVADSMSQAVRELQASEFDVLISDIGLTDGDGWQLLSKLNRPIYAIAMSGFGASADQSRSKAAGYRHHLVKPMGLEHLEDLLREAADELRHVPGSASPRANAA